MQFEEPVQCDPRGLWEQMSWVDCEERRELSSLPAPACEGAGSTTVKATWDRSEWMPGVAGPRWASTFTLASVSRLYHLQSHNHPLYFRGDRVRECAE